MGNTTETNKDEVVSSQIPEEIVESSAEAIYESVKLRMGFPTGFNEAPEPLKRTYRQMALVSLEIGLPLLSAAQENLREARAAELDEFVSFMRGPQPRLMDTYTRRKFVEEATKRAEELRKGNDEN